MIFTLPSGRGIRILLFGLEGSGKTHIAAGVHRLTDRYLYIDVDGSADDHPLHPYTKDEPWGVLALDAAASAEVTRILTAELAARAKGQGKFDVIVLDSFTEFSDAEDMRLRREYIKEHTKAGAKERTLSRYDDLRVVSIDIFQRLIALSNLGVGVVVTASAERGTDPDFPAGMEAVPLCLGSIKHRLGKYFTVSIYVETVAEKKGDKATPKHIYHLLKDGPWRVKNRFEDVFIDDPITLPANLTNPTTESLLTLLHEAAQRKAEKESNANTERVA